MSPEHRLWGAVLTRGIEDALGNVTGLNGGGKASGVKDLAVYRAESWIGSQYFETVCLLAGIDPDAMSERLRPVLALPVPERMKWWRAQKAAALKPRDDYRGTCVIDGCGAAVATKSKTGLCWKHLHAPGVCGCGHCRRHKGGKWAVPA